VSRLKHLTQEIHRRSLWQVLGIYLGGAWVALQGIEALVSVLGPPEWVPGFALVMLILGLPIVPATAFVQEGVGAGEAASEALATSEAEGAATPGDVDGLHLVLTWRNVILGGVVVFAGSLVIYFASPEALLWLLKTSARQSAGPEPHSIRVGEREIAYLEGGTGSPALLLHDFDESGDQWAAIAKHLTPEYRVIAPDSSGSETTSLIAVG
jgi:hypothetical protein